MSIRSTVIGWAIGVGLVAAAMTVAAVYARRSKVADDRPLASDLSSKPVVRDGGSPGGGLSGPRDQVVDLSSPPVVPNTPVVDQLGQPRQFYKDLVEGHVVAINFIFTTCQGVCPPMGTTFGTLESQLKGRGVRLISVSVDPVNDTPAQLAAWARKYGAGPDWTLVTGQKQDIDGLLRSLGVYSANRANHSPLILLGDDRKGAWRRIHGLSTPKRSARDRGDDRTSAPPPAKSPHRPLSNTLPTFPLSISMAGPSDFTAT